MRKFVIIMFSLLSITGLSACDTDDINSSDSLQQSEDADNNQEGDDTGENMKVKITIGKVIFTANLQNNKAASAFKELLPMTITMSDLNNNEKFYDLSNSLPTSSVNPGTIQNGDLMLYGSRTLVLFYKSFSTPYSYTRLGKIDDATGLASALGAGDVVIIFESE